jgi:hypothetical protein
MEETFLGPAQQLASATMQMSLQLPEIHILSLMA